MEAKEGESVTLICEYSLPGVQFHWRKGFESIRPVDKYVMKQRKTVISLTIKHLMPEDSGQYTCQCRDHYTTASLRVNSKIFIMCVLFFSLLPKLCLNFFCKKYSWEFFISIKLFIKYKKNRYWFVPCAITIRRRQQRVSITEKHKSKTWKHLRKIIGPILTKF